MKKKFAIIKNGKVINVIIASQDYIDEIEDDWNDILGGTPADTTGKTAEIGYSYNSQTKVFTQN
jgi:hypothetical protein